MACPSPMSRGGMRSPRLRFMPGVVPPVTACCPCRTTTRWHFCRCRSRLAEEVAVLVNRAALDWQVIAPERDKGGLQSGCANDDNKFRLFQAARIEITEEHAPCGFAFPAHILDGKQHFLPVPAHAYGCQNRDVRGLSIQPGLDDGAIQNQTDDVFVGQIARHPGVTVDLHLAPPAPNRLWVSDFTYVSTWQGFAYVAFVIDTFADRIVGWRVSRSDRPGSSSTPSNKPCTSADRAVMRGWSPIRTVARNTWRCVTPNGLPTRASSRPSDRSATATTVIVVLQLDGLTHATIDRVSLR